VHGHGFEKKKERKRIERTFRCTEMESKKEKKQTADTESATFERTPEWTETRLTARE
jgi:hypothetical protein